MFMVPDFNGLHKQSSEISVSKSGSQSSNLKPHTSSSQLRSFLHTFFEKVCKKHTKSGKNCIEPVEKCVKNHCSRPDSAKSEKPKTANLSTLAQAVTSELDSTHLFYKLWLAQPSWSPIIKRADGWITIVNKSGRKVPLVLGTIESHYRRNIIIGRRPSKLTNYLMIDIDIGSPFHPRNGGISQILAAMESLGLCRYLLIQSSDSGGLHIYFPLDEPVSSWGLACAAHAALTTAGVTIAGGICELFPNKKAFNAEHNGHRLPLQQGSFILDNDFRCIGNAKAVFLTQWQLCAAGQDDMLLTEQLAEKPVATPKPVSIDSLPPIAWTKGSQSNEVMKKLVNYGDRYLGLKTIPALGDWVMTIAPQLPGFEQFASQESKNDLTRRNWAYRWAKSHFKSVRHYAAKTSFDHNAMVAAEALDRLTVALSKIVVVGKVVIRKLWHALSDISKELFGVGFSWNLFQKHRRLILRSIESSRKLGLSRSFGEGESTSFSESASALNPEPKKGLTGLLTAKSMTFKKDNALKASCPPSRREIVAASEEAELATGTAVIFHQPGSDDEGVETRVTGKATGADGTLLYRLEECADGKPVMTVRDCLEVVADKPRSQAGVIQATAAQLVQVLGKACPFVGPGLWPVKRSDVTLPIWNSLQRLVESEGSASEISIVWDNKARG